MVSIEITVLTFGLLALQRNPIPEPIINVTTATKTATSVFTAADNTLGWIYAYCDLNPRQDDSSTL